MTQKTYPPHYTSDDIALVERIHVWMAEHSYTQAALARLSRVAASTLNQILKGAYITSPSKQLAAVESAMRHAEETTSDAVVPVETSVFKLGQTCCAMARRNRNFAVFSGYVGTGKTFAIKDYAA
ncbi:MAG: helix-turn-helix transcriptional regulator, partial [Gallionella sp.]|nr:helix-turn-helix transcriptional regulator [Gallionella sp.]